MSYEMGVMGYPGWVVRVFSIFSLLISHSFSLLISHYYFPNFYCPGMEYYCPYFTKNRARRLRARIEAVYPTGWRRVTEPTEE
jgi:hypothetical protein